MNAEELSSEEKGQRSGKGSRILSRAYEALVGADDDEDDG